MTLSDNMTLSNSYLYSSPPHPFPPPHLYVAGMSPACWALRAAMMSGMMEAARGRNNCGGDEEGEDSRGRREARKLARWVKAFKVLGDMS